MQTKKGKEKKWQRINISNEHWMQQQQQCQQRRRERWWHKPINSMKLNEMENIGLLATPTATVAIAAAAAAAERMMIIII